jgi:hypothetical protein
MDITHLKILNIQLQGNGHLVNDIFTHVKEFEVKLHLCEIQIKQNTLHFQTLTGKAKSVSFNAAKYATDVDILREV